MIYLLAYQLPDGSKGLATTPEMTFVGSNDLEEAKKLVPNWNGYHKGGLTWSTSATLFYASFHPCIAQFDNYEQVFALLNIGEDGNSPIKNQSFAWGRARFTVLKDNSELNIIFDPKLIDKGIETAKPFWEG